MTCFQDMNLKFTDKLNCQVGLVTYILAHLGYSPSGRRKCWMVDLFIQRIRVPAWRDPVTSVDSLSKSPGVCRPPPLP